MTARIVLVLVTVIWGSTFLVIKDAMHTIAPSWFLGIRFLLATLVLTPWALRDSKPTPWVTGLVAGVFLFLGYYLQTLGLKFTGPDQAAFITGLNILFIPLYNWAVYREPVKKAMGGSALLIIIGLGLFLGPKGGVTTGNLLVLGTAMSLAIQIIVTEHIPAHCSWIKFTTLELAVTATMGFLCATTVSAPHFTLSFWGQTAYTGVIATSLALAGQTWGQQRVSAFQAGLIYVFEPVFATIFGVIIGKRPLTVIEGLGAMIMVLAMVGYEWHQAKHLTAPDSSWTKGSQG